MYITMNKTKILEQDQRYLINQNNKWYFVGKDLCVAMEYKNHNSILKKYVSDINKQKYNIATDKGVQTAILLNENGVLELLNHSCKPYAEKFKELLSKYSFIQIIKGYQEVSNISNERGTQEVFIQQDDSRGYQGVHEKPISAQELYNFAESDTPFNEWLLQATLYYSYQTDYFINDNEVFFRNDIAKEVMIHQDNAKGKMYRQNLIAAEKERNYLKEYKESIVQANDFIKDNQRYIKEYIG